MSWKTTIAWGFLLCGALTVLPAFGVVGFQQVRVPDLDGKTLSVTIWYPSAGSSSAPARDAVEEAPIQGADLPLVLISHGTSGSSASHADTALALAEAGFVVAAPTHTGDNFADQRYVGNRIDLTDRPRQLKVVLDFMLSTWPSHDRVDRDRIGVFGFSLGGFTALVISGGKPDPARLLELCKTRPHAPECEFVRQRHGDQLDPATDQAVWTRDRHIKAIVIAAPAVSYLFGPGSLSQVIIPVQLWRAQNDEQVPDEWNTALLRKELPKRPEEHVVAHAGHYAFLPPCSATLAQQAPQICRDPAGFDRADFHRKLNLEIVNFFKSALAG